jgi:hypothetical protein
MTITLTRDEAQQVLDALANAAWCVQHNNLPPDDGHDWDKEIELLRARLAQPEPKPVAWLEPEWGERICPEVGYEVTITADHPKDLCWVPLYPAPPQREWQGLTDEEILEEYRQSYGDDGNLTDVYFARAIEAKLKEKNT